MLKTIAVITFIAANLGTHAPTWEERATAVGNRTWHNPCQGHTRVILDTSQDPYYRYALGWADSTTCTVYVNRAREGSQGYEPYCTVVLHEMGHLAGFGHSSNPNSIMREEIIMVSGTVIRRGRRVNAWGGTDRRCKP